MLKICWKCWHFTNRRGLFGLCYEPVHHLAGMRARGHAPYKCALCPACDRAFFLNNRKGATPPKLFRGTEPRRVIVRPRAQYDSAGQNREV